MKKNVRSDKRTFSSKTAKEAEQATRRKDGKTLFRIGRAL